MSYQDWQTTWTVKNQYNADIDVDTNLSFIDGGDTWTISTSPSCSWDEVQCTYDDTSGLVTGSLGEGYSFIISRNPGSAFIHCDVFPIAATSQSASPEVYDGDDPVTPCGGSTGGTWTAEEGSG
ncbi:MAG: hypothetical protein WAM82_31940 [Thermoanaerobaculia bacterium]